VWMSGDALLLYCSPGVRSLVLVGIRDALLATAPRFPYHDPLLHRDLMEAACRCWLVADELAIDLHSSPPPPCSSSSLNFLKPSLRLSFSSSFHFVSDLVVTVAECCSSPWWKPGTIRSLPGDLYSCSTLSCTHVISTLALR
jgi:hypothetical protein